MQCIQCPSTNHSPSHSPPHTHQKTQAACTATWCSSPCGVRQQCEQHFCPRAPARWPPRVSLLAHYTVYIKQQRAVVEGWRGGWRGLRCESTLVNASCAAATWQPAGLVTSRVTRLHGASAIVATYGLYPPLLASRAAGPQFEIARRVEVLYCYLRQPCSWSSSMGQQNMITHA